MQEKKIQTALISVYDKNGLKPLLKELVASGVKLFSTGGTQTFIEALNYPVTAVEDLTGYPSILGGRVKTLHPKIFGGILSRSENEEDYNERNTYEIPAFDLVIVDLYPFEETVASGASETAIIEKIDIGGIALIRAAAKNFASVFCVSSRTHYNEFLTLFKENKGTTKLTDRKRFAVKAFHTSSHYDTAIFNHFNTTEKKLKVSISEAMPLRYGENPHQEGYFFGPLNELIEKCHGKEISYNNLLDIDAAVQLILEFYEGKPAFAILKHNNACGVSVRDTLAHAFKDALAGDPVSAFGGVLITNKIIDLDTAMEIHPLFCEVVIAPGYTTDALKLLKTKKNRILVVLKETKLPSKTLRSCLNGVLVQDRNSKTDRLEDLRLVTKRKPTASENEDLLFASKISKHTRSNTIVLAKNNQLLGSGTGQTSRVDALHQAIHKAKTFDFDLNGAVMASDAFFPFPDCVEISAENGIKTIIQPGGSVKDQLSINACDNKKLAMVFSGTRHFKH